ncbi:MAG TPA: LLM class flavin-dependent oxidoreductase, partial [Nitrososphaerales archaeon]|nr:LLM class flavin-dependent oxidoreductase [Nitrososphaerales archaeon]
PRRFLLGLGTSGKRLVEGWHGVSFANPLERTGAYVEIIRTILRGREARYDGELFKLSRFRLYSAPPETDIEIYLAAMGEKNLRLASYVADGAIVTFYPVSQLRQCAESINQSSSNQKKLFAYLPLRIVESDGERQEARIELSKYIAFYIASMGKYYAQNLSKLGFEKEVEQILLARREKKELSVPLTDEFFDELCLVGSKEEIFERVSKLPKTVHPVFGLDPKSPRQADWLVDLAENETSS